MADGRARLNASMGPQHRCCGNTCSRSRPIPAGFNGAAASMLRKWRRGGQQRPGRCASMGPQHRCCGNDRRCSATSTRVGRFNGAAASMLRKSMTLKFTTYGFNGAAASMLRKCRSDVRVRGLQWGRSIDAAEIVALLSYSVFKDLHSLSRAGPSETRVSAAPFV